MVLVATVVAVGLWATEGLESAAKRMEAAYEKIRGELKNELVDRLKGEAAHVFERIVIELLVKMGYGGSRANAWLILPWTSQAACGSSQTFFHPFPRYPDASPVAAVVHVDPQTGERTIFYMAKQYHLLKAADIPLDAVRRAKLVLVDGYERDAAPTVLEVVRESGGRSVLDVEAGDPRVALRLLELSTDCILPLSEAHALTGEENAERALRCLAKKTTAQLIVTDERVY